MSLVNNVGGVHRSGGWSAISPGQPDRKRSGVERRRDGGCSIGDWGLTIGDGEREARWSGLRTRPTSLPSPIYEAALVKPPVQRVSVEKLAHNPSRRRRSSNCPISTVAGQGRVVPSSPHSLEPEVEGDHLIGMIRPSGASSWGRGAARHATQKTGLVDWVRTRYNPPPWPGAPSAQLKYRTRVASASPVGKRSREPARHRR